ncbi:Holliday junction branch migration protein RuvA [Desulfallas thermosapovorans]|uniref:Holliday junction branch migration complex subunit RuvA n=1 Tax=Desulfallas thermosapovorans DSM 6562 TaxID=1121431 RepID=A0A5S4ZYK9_9FIRM|nr:Holliday junction branch migration protein RuvA [Desulfallas thermosapovorans]TYO97945.1 Holliday junction DNA helicase subunit RuvA [Desulfallas thermosapovorans DSM 6562]
MIAFLRGAVAGVENETVVLDVHGVGYKVNVTAACAASLAGQVDKEVFLHTHMIVREDDMQLYGFFSADEINVFLLLLGVNGVGPRAALAVLSHLTPQGLARAVTLGDLTALTKVPGVGKKIAQRIVLELKDKFKKLAVKDAAVPPQPGETAVTGAAGDALAGLMALGYGAGEARAAVHRAMNLAVGNNPGVAELIKLSLRFLDKSK